ncbi:MAG: sulfite exporter TauE/SafE family protein [Chloroflexi bacterium]|nr:sulfite exporter TauE/SafE family protein [Chloroflexota bacterium]
MTALIAFGSGLLSFLSPCVLPMVPIYIGYLSGAAVTPDGITTARRSAVAHAGAFVLGFTLIFIAIWSALSALTVIFSKSDIGHVAGIILIIFAFHFIGIEFHVGRFKFSTRLPFLYQEARVEVGQRPLGYPTSLLTGMAFAAGWTPCIGPTLSGVIALATQEQTVWQGTALLLAYAAGLGVPFILTAFFLGSATQLLKRLSPHLRKVEIASGVLLLAMGVLLLTDKFTFINSFFFNLTPDWLKQLL